MHVVAALCMLKPQIKIRDNLLELEWIWSHHYLQQKHLAVLLSIFHNTTAPTLDLWVSLFPDFTQVCLLILSTFVVAEKLSFFFFHPSIWSNVQTDFFPKAHLAFLHFLEGRWDRPQDTGMGKLQWYYRTEKAIDSWITVAHIFIWYAVKHFMTEVAVTFLKQQ